jgi:hypothetical protein
MPDSRVDWSVASGNRHDVVVIGGRIVGDGHDPTPDSPTEGFMTAAGRKAKGWP